MTAQVSGWSVVADLGRSAGQWCIGWWQIILFSAKLLVLALSPSSYRCANLAALARHLVKDTTPVLLWFTLMTSIISLVIIHIVVVTSVSYGLSRYALEMVVRVLVLELIPLTAAMFVTCTPSLRRAVLLIRCFCLRAVSSWLEVSHTQTLPTTACSNFSA